MAKKRCSKCGGSGPFYKRSDRLYGAAGTLTPGQWLEILEYFNHACAYCLRTDRPLTQDHLIPLSKGGEHTAENVVPACCGCNSQKKDRPIFMMVAA